MSDVAAIHAPRPYLWGRFQGWALIAISLIQLAVTIVLLHRPDYLPHNGVALGYFKAFLRNHAGANGIYLAVFYLVTLCVGILVLKKRMSVFLFLFAVILGTAIQVQLGQVAFWIVCTVYYWKRRKEFSWP